MTFHKEGVPSLLLAFAVAIILHFSVSLTVGPGWLLYLAWSAGAFLVILMLQFFRKPKRDFNETEGKIISPCDGKVVVIEEVEEGEFFKDKRIQISIFMSPLNVHINWNPINGIFKYVKYHSGKYLMAFDPKSSLENERSTVVIEHESGFQVLFRQVAGFLARRIVYYAKEGEKASLGHEMGFIKFGSRIDIYLPIGTELDVKIGDVVKGGISSIASFSK